MTVMTSSCDLYSSVAKLSAIYSTKPGSGFKDSQRVYSSIEVRTCRRTPRQLVVECSAKSSEKILAQCPLFADQCIPSPQECRAIPMT